MGGPTVTFDRIVASNDSSAYLAATSSDVRHVDAAIENRPAVLALAELQVRRVLGRLQRIALRVDEVERRLFAADLAAEQQVDVEAEVVPLERRAIDLGHPPHALADDAGGVIHRAGLRQALAGVEVEAQQRHDRLADRQAAARRG